MVPEAHQNNHSYVLEISAPPFDSPCKNFAWWEVTQRTSNKQTNKHKTVKIRGGDGHFHRDGHLPRAIQHMWSAITIFDVMRQK